MIVKPQLFENILFGELAPWNPLNIGEVKFKDILNNGLRSVKDNPSSYFNELTRLLSEFSIQLTIEYLPDIQHYSNTVRFSTNQADFKSLSLPVFFNKTSEFYYYLIKNEHLRVKSAITANTVNAQNQLDISYQVSCLLMNLNHLIEHIHEKKADDKISSYVLLCLKLILVQLYEEIKLAFPYNIGDDILSIYELANTIEPEFESEKSNKGTFSYFISQYLAENEIDSSIVKTPQLAAKTEQSITYYSFYYKNYNARPDCIVNLCNSLKKFKFIDKDTELSIFRKIFSGEEINQPVIWTGNISDLSYFIKLIHNKYKSVKNLKQRQWEVACICFVQKDGAQWNRKSVKDQKIPVLTASNLEKAASQLI